MDGGSSLNLLYQDTMRKMGIHPSWIKPTKTTFKGVIPGVEARCTGSIMLEVVFGSYLNLKMPGPHGVITVNGNTERSLHTEEHTAALAAEV